MELLDLKFSETVRLHVEVIDDYNIKGSFDPNAESDIEFYGYRETIFNVIGVDSLLVRADYKLWLPEEESVAKEFAKYFDDKITLIVQNAIDEREGVDCDS